MLKHTDITTRRISQFAKNELLPALLADLAELSVEFCPVAHPDQASAEAGPWEPVKQGFEYGPAYRTAWFRLRGKLPEGASGEIGLIAEVGGERTVWRDNSPWRGLDEPHNVLPVANPDARATSFSPDARPGAKIEVYVQAYTMNPQVRVHGREPEREALVAKVGPCKLVSVDRDVLDLLYDFEFASSLLGALADTDPSHAILLRALNDVCNAYAVGKREAITRCRKIVREALTSLPGPLKHSIVPVGHAHLDTAWLWPLEMTMKKMAHTTATQLHLLERYPEYVFCHSQASQYEWLELQYPKLFERVREAIRQGRWEVVGSMWVEADCNLTGAESLVRQFLYGRRYFKEKLGITTDDMWLPDVFGYAASLPQILEKFNIRYFLTQKISWNQFNKFPHHTFWWQGIDGTKVWTHFPPADTYNSDCTPKEMLYVVKNYKDHARMDSSLYLFGFGDGGGGPTERHLEYLRRARSAAGLPEVQSGKTALEFFKEARAKSKDLATWAGELYLEYHRGTYTSQAANKKANRTSEFLLRDAELLSCFVEDFPASYPRAELEQAWKLVLLNQFHDIIPGSSVREVYEDSARDYSRVLGIGEAIIHDALTKIGGAFDTSAMERPLALFQNAMVGAQGEMPWGTNNVPTCLTVGEESLPVQLVDDFGEQKLIFPTPAGALGAVTVGDLCHAPPGRKYRHRVSSRKIESDELAIRFDANGNITSVESLEDGSEFIEPGKLANVFQLFDDKPLFWSAWDVDVYAFETGRDLLKSESFEIVERGPVRSAVKIVKRFGNSTITQKISLGPTPGIRFDTEIDWHEEDKMLKTAFPVNVNAQRATFEVQFGSVERPTHANTSWDVARFEVAAQKWADLSEGDQGVALLNDSKYGCDIRGNVMRLSLLRSPKAPDPTCDMGRHRFVYVLLPHFGPHNYAGVVQAAYALNAPVRWAWLPRGSGVEAGQPPFVSCEDRNIVIETVKKAEDSDHVIVRMYECHNSRGWAELFCIRPIRAAALCDLEENVVGELDVQDGLAIFDYRPFEIVTVRLEF